MEISVCRQIPVVGAVGRSRPPGRAFAQFKCAAGGAGAITRQPAANVPHDRAIAHIRSSAERRPAAAPLICAQWIALMPPTRLQ